MDKKLETFLKENYGSVLEADKLSPDYKIAIGKIKRYFGDSNPSESDIVELANTICKKEKMDKNFVQYIKDNMKLFIK